MFDLPLIDLASVFGKVFTRSCMTKPQAFSTLFGSSHKCMVKTVGLHNLQPSNDYNHLVHPCWLMVSFLAFDHPSQTQSTLLLHERMHAIMWRLSNATWRDLQHVLWLKYFIYNNCIIIVHKTYYISTQWQYISMMSISRSTVYRLQLYNVLTTKAFEGYKTVLCLTKTFEEVITGS